MSIYRVKKLFVYLLIISLIVSSVNFPNYSNAVEAPATAIAALDEQVAVPVDEAKQKQLEELQKALEKATSKKEKDKIKQKMKNVREDAQKKKTGEEHSKGSKR